MILLADENFPQLAGEMLVAAGLANSYTIHSPFGTPDTEVLANTIRRNAILLSQDKDFGDLIFRDKYPSPKGIVLFRYSQPFRPALAGERLIELLQAGFQLEGQFTVITPDNYRQRRLPKPAGN